eukprot:3731389-Alexandrium_andersonii.AAC.1
MRVRAWSSRASRPSAAACSTGGAARWAMASAWRCCATTSGSAGASATAAGSGWALAARGAATL